MHQQDENILPKKELCSRVGANLKKLRKAQNLSQAEVGFRCGKDKQHIELVENGKVTPSIYTLYMIAKALNVSLEELFREIE